jgi:hypothetical protein
VAWPVIVVVATNYICVVGNFGATLAIVFSVLLSSHKPALIDSDVPQEATTTVAACGLPLPMG